MATTSALLLAICLCVAQSREASKCQVDLLIVMDMSGTQNFNRTAMQCSQEKADFVTTLANRIASQQNVDNFIGLAAFSTDIRPASSNYFYWNRYDAGHNSTWKSMAGQACGGLTRFVPAARKAIEMMNIRNVQTQNGAIPPVKELVIVSDGRWDDSNDPEWHTLPETARQLGYHLTAVMIGGSAAVMGPASQKNMLALVSSNGNKVIWDKDTALSTVSERILDGFQNAECLNIKGDDNAILSGGDQCQCPCACNTVGSSIMLPNNDAKTPMNTIDYSIDYPDTIVPAMMPAPEPVAPVINPAVNIVRPSGYVRR